MTDRSPPTPPPDEPAFAPATDAELHAHADRRLTADRDAEVEAWLASRPDDAARVRAWVDQKRELRGLFDPVLDEAVPPTLRQLARRRLPWYRHPVAAGLLLAVIAGGAGWTLRGADDRALLAAAASAQARDVAIGTEFATRAAIAHAVYTPDVRRPVEVDAAHEDQLVTWLSRRMGAAMKAPHLQSVGYALEGGRLLPGEHGPVAQFMYRDDAGHRLTLYVSNDAGPGAASAVPSRAAAASAPDTAFQFVREGQVNVFYWVDGPFRYAITAATDRAALARVSDEVFRQLDAGRP
jgi:anti-sigma factor RsiW